MAGEATVAVLRGTPLVGLLDEDALRIVANVADARRLRPGEVLFRQGDRSDGGYVVISGSIGIGREGAEEDEVTPLGPGSLIGQTALFLRMQRPATAFAREASNVIRISPTLMKRVLQEYPSAAAGIADALSRDLEAVAAGLARVQGLFPDESGRAA
jgi:CRP-like cAMP-binding protein